MSKIQVNELTIRIFGFFTMVIDMAFSAVVAVRERSPVTDIVII